MEVMENKDDDSSDSDIFILKQIKPVSAVTIQEALIIKHSVLNSAKSKNKVKNKKIAGDVNEKKINKKQRISSQQQKVVSPKAKKGWRDKSNKVTSNDRIIIPENGEVKCQAFKRNSSGEVKQSTSTGLDAKKTSPTKITDYFTGCCKEPEKSQSNVENIQLSPGISRRRKKFKINDNSPKSPVKSSPVKKSLAKAFTELKDEPKCKEEKSKNDVIGDLKDVEIKIEFGPFCEPEFENELVDVLNSVEKLDEDNFENNSELLSFLLKKVILNEIEKQNNLENLVSENGIKPEKLLRESEEKILKQFLYLNKSSSKVLVRMLCRKKDWHRVSTLNLKDVKDCEKEFKMLHKENFVDVNIGTQDIRTQINLLSKPEIFQLCRTFNVFLKSGPSSKKQDLITALLESSIKQKSVFDMFSKNRTSTSNSRLNLIQSEVKHCLGFCVKLSETTLSAFNKIMLLFSFAHYYDEEDKRFSNQLFMCLKVFKNMMKFPNYKLSPCVVFETRADFEEFEKALMVQKSFEIATANKQFDEFVVIGKKAEVEFRRLLNDVGFNERFLRLKPFLKKFNGGTIYAKILTNYCSLFKKQTNSKHIISVAELLLGQNVFLISKRGEWYKILSKALENQRKMNAASELLIKSLNDPLVNEVQRLTLQLRGHIILKRKSNGVSDAQLREALNNACAFDVQEPASIEIKGQALQGNEKGYRCVYVEQRHSGKVYSTVEEKAISYYRSNGYTHGFHVEGYIIYSMYFLVFYDIIYELSPIGVFLTPYQEAPLDFYSSCFYLNRKNEIDLLFAEMLSWSDAEIEAKLNDVYNKHVDTTCLIAWKEGFTPELFCEILKCLTMPVFVSICRRLVTNFRAMRSGFPDLTLWNPSTKKCKFVEVKSPNDKLSPAQRIWLDFLKNIGIDCEVCNVKNTSAKKSEAC